MINCPENTIDSADIMLSLCDSVVYVLNTATKTDVKYTPMVQTICKTSLKPDVSTFVIFTGSFSGLVVLNFTKEAAMEFYTNYMASMGIKAKDLAKNYTSEEVQNSLGELMNQILGHFTSHISSTLHGRITQSQPKMLALPHEVQISMNMALDNPVIRRVTFTTSENEVFYLELAMDDTSFTKVRDFQEHSQLSPDEIIALVNAENK